MTTFCNNLDTIKCVLALLAGLDRGAGNHIKKHLGRLLYQDHLTHLIRLGINAGNLQYSISRFISRANKLYVKLSKNARWHAVPFNLVNNANEPFEKLKQCLPKFLASLSYLWYHVDTAYGSGGGGGWADKRTRHNTHAICIYLTAKSSDADKYKGIFPGGFEFEELRSLMGRDLAAPLKELLTKDSHGYGMHNHFRNVLFFTLKERLEAVNTGNAVGVVYLFCQIVAKETKKSAFYSALIKSIGIRKRCFSWRKLKVVCAKLKLVYDDMLKNGFDIIGHLTNISHISTSSFVVKFVEWYRNHYDELLQNLKTMDSTVKKYDMFTWEPFVKNVLFPNGFIFKETKASDASNSLDLWHFIDVIEKLIDKDDGLIALKNVLEYGRCQPKTRRVPTGADLPTHQGPVTLNQHDSLLGQFFPIPQPVVSRNSVQHFDRDDLSQGSSYTTDLPSDSDTDQRDLSINPPSVDPVAAKGGKKNQVPSPPRQGSQSIGASGHSNGSVQTGEMGSSGSAPQGGPKSQVDQGPGLSPVSNVESPGSGSGTGKGVTASLPGPDESKTNDAQAGKAGSAGPPAQAPRIPNSGHDSGENKGNSGGDGTQFENAEGHISPVQRSDVSSDTTLTRTTSVSSIDSGSSGPSGKPHIPSTHSRDTVSSPRSPASPSLVNPLNQTDSSQGLDKDGGQHSGGNSNNPSTSVVNSSPQSSVTQGSVVLGPPRDSGASSQPPPTAPSVVEDGKDVHSPSVTTQQNGKGAQDSSRDDATASSTGGSSSDGVGSSGQSGPPGGKSKHTPFYSAFDYTSTHTWDIFRKQHYQPTLLHKDINPRGPFIRRNQDASNDHKDSQPSRDQAVTRQTPLGSDVRRPGQHERNIPYNGVFTAGPVDPFAIYGYGLSQAYTSVSGHSLVYKIPEKGKPWILPDKNYVAGEWTEIQDRVNSIFTGEPEADAKGLPQTVTRVFEVYGIPTGYPIKLQKPPMKPPTYSKKSMPFPPVPDLIGEAIPDPTLNTRLPPPPIEIKVRDPYSQYDTVNSDIARRPSLPIVESVKIPLPSIKYSRPPPSKPDKDGNYDDPDTWGNFKNYGLYMYPSPDICRNAWNYVYTFPIPPTQLSPPDSDLLPSPTTVREMLYWLVGLLEYGYIAKIAEYVEAILLDFKISYQFPEVLGITGFENLTISFVVATLTEACLYAANVIYEMKYYDDYETVKNLQFDAVYRKLHYSSETSCLLCQLRDYVYACQHQLAFLRSQCSRGKFQGGWMDHKYGSDITSTTSPLQAFLTDSRNSAFKTHPFNPCDICLKSRVNMGFGAEDLPKDIKTGIALYNILSPNCSIDDPLLILSPYLVCLTGRTPRTTGELVSFFQHFGNEMYVAFSGELSNVGAALTEPPALYPIWDHLEAHDLRTVRDIRGSYDSKADHPKTLSALIGCDIYNVNCVNHFTPITYQAYSLYSPIFAHTYLIWMIHFADILRDSLERLRAEFRCHDCSNFNSVYQCEKVMPLLYLHGFTPPDGTSKLSLTCADVVKTLDAVVYGRPVANLISLTDEFLYRVRKPFILFGLAIWSLTAVYFAHIAICRLDVLRLLSHRIRTKASHLINIAALLAHGIRMPSLYDIQYFDDDLHTYWFY
ncbi:hypothetical protein BBBOND_0403850 [Babesia bigemina]|uniref:Ribosome binding protein n=1 Tax=Babesia bigemina TaxID=5866 RepID=A0A061DCN2_BABBI|nr:hypothetical protein BBBOND_0403850 [Babesia bigemina]CDR97897.1 hypothetical protein BBBOND_0403850 [Babesia bigemina]|eukprot:XP_012770083.1 hypothetical protein BBBOND_0403850 [Babesia bigemina]